MLQPLISLLTCLVWSVAAQQSYYCNSIAPEAIIRDREFYVITRERNESGYLPGMICEFNAISDTNFFLEIETFKVANAVLTVSSGLKTLFRGSRLRSYQSSIATPPKYLQIRFESKNDASYRDGVVIRVRVFNLCPPGWTDLYGNCFGTSATSGRLKFAEAQKACNNMRANLLHIPSSFYGTDDTFMRILPGNLRMDYTWIGLTDKAYYGIYSLKWLSGAIYRNTGGVRCLSSGAYRHNCSVSERCATFNDKSYAYTIYMINCEESLNFACSMPPGGTGYFYVIPDGRSSGAITPGASSRSAIDTAPIWGSILVGVALLTLIFIPAYAFWRCKRARSSLRASSMGVIVTAGRTTASQRYPEAPQSYAEFYAASSQYPPYPPPPYSETVSGGSSLNAGYID